MIVRIVVTKAELWTSSFKSKWKDFRVHSHERFQKSFGSFWCRIRLCILASQSHQRFPKLHFDNSARAFTQQRILKMQLKTLAWTNKNCTSEKLTGQSLNRLYKK